MGAALSPILAIGSSIYGASRQRKAQKKARASQAAAEAAAAARFAPYEATGRQGTELLREGLSTGTLGGSFTPENFTTDPGYQFRLEEGQKGLDRLQAARGNLYSGQAIKEAERFRQGLADQAYEDAYNRWRQQQLDRYSMLSGAANQGLRAAGGGADIGLMSGENQARYQLGREEATQRGIGQSLATLDEAAGSFTPFFGY